MDYHTKTNRRAVVGPTPEQRIRCCSFNRHGQINSPADACGTDVWNCKLYVTSDNMFTHKSDNRNLSQDSLAKIWTASSTSALLNNSTKMEQREIEHPFVSTHQPIDDQHEVSSIYKLSSSPHHKYSESEAKFSDFFHMKNEKCDMKFSPFHIGEDKYELEFPPFHMRQEKSELEFPPFHIRQEKSELESLPFHMRHRQSELEFPLLNRDKAKFPSYHDDKIKFPTFLHDKLDFPSCPNKTIEDSPSFYNDKTSLGLTEKTAYEFENNICNLAQSLCNLEQNSSKSEYVPFSLKHNPCILEQIPYKNEVSSNTSNTDSNSLEEIQKKIEHMNTQWNNKINISDGKITQTSFKISSSSRKSFRVIPPQTNTNNFCSFCKSNGDRKEFYMSHSLKDSMGVVICPILRAYICELCGATGANAHTLSHCPLNDGASHTKHSVHKRCGRGFVRYSHGKKWVGDIV